MFKAPLANWTNLDFFFRSLGEIVKLIHKKEQVKVVLRT